jgi:capsular exopolysaccharide synthesis family protein
MSYPVTDNDTELVAESNAQFDIKKFIYRLVGFLPWIVISVLISYGAAMLYLRYTPKYHKIAADLLIKDEEQNNSDNRVLEELGVMPNSMEVQNEIDILQSFSLAASVVDSLNLQLVLIEQGRIASQALYGSRSPVEIKSLHGDSTRFKPSASKLVLKENHFVIIQGNQNISHNYGDTFFFAGKKVFFLRNAYIKINPRGYNLTVRATQDVARALASGLNVKKIHDMGGILEIGMLDEVPQRAIDIINKLIESYNTAGIMDKDIAGYKTMDFIKDRLDTVSSELDSLEIKTDEFKRDNNITDISDAGQQYLTEVLGYDKSKTEQNGKLILLQSIENYINSSKNFTDIIPTDKGLGVETLSKLIGEYNAAVLELQNQEKISTDKDPIISRLKNNLTELKGNIIKNIENIKTGFQSNYEQMSATENNFNKLLAALPEKERELVKLKRQSGVIEQLYLYLLQKKEETQVSLASNINNTRVVDEAFDQGIVLPKFSQIKMFAFLIGVFIPIIVMLLLDFFNNKITDRKEVEEGTRAPIFGELSFDRKVQNIINSAKSRSVIAEQLRLVRTNLHYMGGSNPVKTILVTSFMSGEGKSFVSINLSISLSSNNAKVLLIELDLRKPKFSKYLELTPEYGLTDYIVNNLQIKDIITKLPNIEGVDVITAGPLPPNPAEFLSSPKFAEIFNKLKDQYDYIVIDSAPIGLVADTFSLEAFADATLFVVRHIYSFKTTIQFIEKLYVEKRFKNIGVIVNGIRNVQGVGYGYGYAYGYSYGYGYTQSNGYFDSDKKKSGFFKNLFSVFTRK